MKRRLMVLWLTVVAIGALLGAGSAQARLDPSFGEGGILHLSAPPVPSGAERNYVQSAFVGPGGEYFVFAYQGCAAPTSTCPGGTYLYRYLPDGSLDQAFAGGRGFFSPEGPSPAEAGGASRFAIDSSGRPVWVRNVGGPVDESELLIRRVDRSGVAEAGFGAGGVARLSCPDGCSSLGVLPRPDGSTLLTALSRFSQGKELSEPILNVYAINAQGFPIKKFPLPVTFALPNPAGASQQALTPGGGLYLAGSYGQGPILEETPVNELRRISASGRLDTKFGATAARSLVRLLRLNGEGGEIKSLLVWPGGKVELFGAIGKYNGFQLRLLPSGKTDRSFGKNGLRKYQFVPGQVVAGIKGAAMVLATESGFTNRVFRLFPDGRVDPRFGVQGEEIPGADGEPGESGITLFRAGKGRVAVTDLDYRYCRQVCPSDPKMFRFLEGK
jgi:hypothetical protein